MKPENNIQDVSVRAIVFKLINNWYYFAGSLALAIILAYFFIQTRPRIFESAASMLLYDRNREGNNPQEFMKEIGFFSPNNALRDEIAILRSRSLMLATLKKINTGISYYETKWLFSEELPPEMSPFHISIDSSHLQLTHIPIQITANQDQGVIVYIEESEAFSYDPKSGEEVSAVQTEDVQYSLAWGETLELPILRFTISKNEDYPISQEKSYMFTINAASDLIREYNSRLKISPASDDANIVDLKFSGPFINHNSTFIDELMYSYLYQFREKRQEIGSSAIDFIDDQIADLSDSLKDTENKLEKFRTEQEVVEMETSVQILYEQMSETEQELLNTKGKLSYFEYLVENIESEGDISSIPAPSSQDINDPLMKGLLQQLSEMTTEKALAEFNTTEKNPQYLLLVDRIKNTKNAILKNAKNHIQNIKTRIAELRSNKASLQAKINKLPGYEKQLTKINRDYESVSEMYKYLMEKKAEAGIALANQSMSNQIIDPAHLTSRKPVSPRKNDHLRTGHNPGTWSSFHCIDKQRLNGIPGF